MGATVLKTKYMLKKAPKKSTELIQRITDSTKK
jgi:hypothetical protein